MNELRGERHKFNEPADLMVVPLHGAGDTERMLETESGICILPPMQNQTLCYSSLGSVLLVAHNDQPPKDEEWTEFLKVLRKSVIPHGNIVAILVVSDGGGPTMQQRDQLGTIPGAAFTPTVVVTPSLLTRLVIQVLRWLGHELKAFAPDELEEACAFLGIVLESHQREVLRRVVEMRGKLIDQVLDATQLEHFADEGENVREIVKFVVTERLGDVRNRLNLLKRKHSS